MSFKDAVLSGIIVTVIGGLILYFITKRIETTPEDNKAQNSAISVESKSLEIPSIYGKTYHQARKILVKSGWIPYPTYRWQDVGSHDFEMTVGWGKCFWDKGYEEVELCSPMGWAPCNFRFKSPNGDVIHVITQGEEDETINAYAVVTDVFRE